MPTTKKSTSTTKRPAAKKTAAKKTAAKKSTATRRATTKSATKKSATSATKKSATKKSATKNSTATRKASAKSSPDDAIAVLKADHRRVSELFDKFEGLGERAHKTRESTMEKIIEELSVHAGIEETVFYPAVRERFAANQDSQILEALEEHHVVKLLLDEIQAMPSESERYTAKATVLREIVDHHVDEEESELFKQVRKQFTRSELVELGEAVQEARGSAPKRPHPSAPDTPPGNTVANVLAAPLDAVTGITSRAAGAVRGAID